MRTLVLVSLTFATSIAWAQRQRVPDVSPQQDAEQQLLAAQAEATASAVRAGDEDLSCEALQTEMMTIAQSMQSGVQPFAQQATADLAQAQEAQQAAEAQARQTRPRFGQMVRGLATGVVPGADRASAAAQQAESIAQAEQAQAQTNANLERINALSGNVAAMAGPAMRGERVLELARTRECAWLQEGGPLPGALPPAATAPPALAAPQ